MEVVRIRTSHVEIYPLNINGESFHRDEIESIIGYTDDDGVDEDHLTAHLILEDNNPHDRYAVLVMIDGVAVGRLSREDARQYRLRLNDLTKEPVIGECEARITGGFLKDGERADYSVKLDLDLEYPLITEDLPSTSAAVAPPKPPESTGKRIAEYLWRFIRWAFARSRWWKTVLIIFIASAIISGLLR